MVESLEVLEEYVDKIHESGMNALCVEARPHPDFVGEKWWSDMDCILKKVKEHNMKMWILDDSIFLLDMRMEELRKIILNI